MTWTMTCLVTERTLKRMRKIQRMLMMAKATIVKKTMCRGLLRVLVKPVYQLRVKPLEKAQRW